jgi:hypothetical protein
VQEEGLHNRTGLLQLRPKGIDCKGPWLFWQNEPGEHLLQSLQEWGQLEPILVRRGRQAWELVSGYKRCRALQQLGRLILAREIQGQELQLGLIRLQANLGAALSPEMLVSASRYFQSRVRVQELPSLLQRWFKPLLPRKDWPLFWSWLQLPLEYDQVLQQGNLPLEAASRLQALDNKALQELLPLFQSLSWSGNQARNLLQWLQEAAQMQARSISQLVMDLDLAKILKQDLSPKDAKQKILDRVQDKRFPCLQSLESDFRELRKQLQTRYWKIQPEKNFETDALYLQAKIPSATYLLSAAQELQEILDSKAWIRLMKWQTKTFYPE